MTPNESKEYERQIRSQIEQYADVEEMHSLPASFHYINRGYLAPRLDEIFGVASVTEFYGKHIAEAVERTGQRQIISLGSGYGALEIEIAKWARSNDSPAFKIVCLELSPLLTKRTERSARAEGVEDVIVAQEADVNLSWPVRAPIAAVMAHHALHHFVGLETIFSQIATLLHPEGSFVTIDMVGRNGHMRWPESLSIVRQIWRALPERLKWDHSLSRRDRWFENWDCSIEGFEGIRAQDILPELVERFRFDKFYANGGIVDIFCDRRFGPNFSCENVEDIAFLDAVQALEDTLLEAGLITPVQAFAVMRSMQSSTSSPAPICYKGITPEKALRPIHADRTLPVSIVDRLFSAPYADPSSLPPLAALPRRTTISFAPGGEGELITRWGWGIPDRDLTWAVGCDSALEFQAADTIDEIRIRLVGYVAPKEERPLLTIRLNGVTVMVETLNSTRAKEYIVRLKRPLLQGKRALLEFNHSRPRRPDVDGGPDNRPLSFAILWLKLDGPKS